MCDPALYTNGASKNPKKSFTFEQTMFDGANTSFDVEENSFTAYD